MDKYERVLKGKAKFKKRLKNLGIKEKDLHDVQMGSRSINYNCYRTTGKPCSCPMCSPAKVEEKAKYRLNKFDKNQIDE